MELLRLTHARTECAGGVQTQLNYGRRTLSTRESVLLSEKKRGERYLAFTGVDVL